MPDYSFEPSEDGVYWFARDLIAGDYAQFGKQNPEASKKIRTIAESYLSNEYEGSLNDIREEIRETIVGSKNKMHNGNISKTFLKTQNFADRVVARIDDERDLRELQLAIDIVTETTEIMDESPTYDSSMIEATVDEELGQPPQEENAYSALYECDLRGEAYQVGGQRVPLAEFLAKIRGEIEEEYDKENIERIVSAAAQEYERRAGQSRNSSAGNVLETGLQYLFDTFDIETTGAPKHYGDFEIDNEVFGPNGSIGFSCKRTQRERFKQSLPRESDIGVDEIWFITLQLSDISGNKLELLEDVGRLYVPQSSYVWDYYKDDYPESIFPAEEFISDIRDFTGQQ